MEPISRRRVLGALVAGVSLPAVARVIDLPRLGDLLTGPAHAVEDGTSPRSAYAPVPNNPVYSHSVGGDPIPEPLMFPTLLPLGHLMSGALDAWYLWASHHNYPRFHTWTAPEPEGPFTYRGFSEIPSPGLPPNYQTVPLHFQCPDIVWDPVGHRLVGTPHSIRMVGEQRIQDSFLIQSLDGITWTWLDGDNSPRLLCGAAGDVDSVHTGYGRLLRDLDGILVTFNGRYWWAYRGDTPTTYTPCLASTPSLSSYPWQKEGPTFTTPWAPTDFVMTGSFLSTALKHWVAYHSDPNSAQGGLTPWLTASAGNDFSYGGSQAVPVILGNGSASAITASGANIIRHPVTGYQYWVDTAATPLGLNRWFDTQVRIYKATVQ